MSIWTEVRPPKPPDVQAQPGTPGYARTLLGLVGWLPAIVAIAAGIAGLSVVASQQSATSPEPIIRDVAAPITTHHTLIDLNTATIAELATLPGIGTSRAESIVILRAQQPFSSPADLVERGILRPSEALAIADLAAVYVVAE